MFRISTKIAKLEDKAERRFGKWFARYGSKWKSYLPLLLICLYFYGMAVNSIRLGIQSTFGGEPVESIWVWNPFQNILAAFSLYGLGIAAICLLLIALITKKGYNILSGYKFEHDKRGFDILPDGTHGTSGFMKRADMEKVLNLAASDKLTGTILGKLKDSPDDSDRFAEYVSLKSDCGLNNHTLIFGASGSGKSRGFVKPFILQAAGGEQKTSAKESLILVDPKGEFFQSMSEYLREKGYVVKVFNLLDMENSDAWNCMHDLENDSSLVQTIAEVIIKNTSNANERQDFWEKAEMNLLMALLHYTLTKSGEHGRLEEIQNRSLGSIYRLLSEESFFELENRFSELPKNHPAQAPYGIFKLANRQIWGNIAIGLGNRLGVFQDALVDKITSYNEIDLELPGKQPCAYFCVISDQDSSLEFLSSLFFSMLFSRLTSYARREGINGRLPVTVNFCLDEFCNIGKIVDFKKLISTVRSRGINCQIIAQSAAQLSDRYERKEWEEIIGNCDTQIFLGGNDQMTADYLSKKCGSASVRITSHAMPVQPLFSPVYSSTRPYTQTRSTTQRPLMMPDEILRMDNRECLVLIRGQKPLKLCKVTPEELPEFKLLRETRIKDYIPEWRKEHESAPAAAAPVPEPKKPEPEQHFQAEPTLPSPIPQPNKPERAQEDLEYIMVRGNEPKLRPYQEDGEISSDNIIEESRGR